MRLFRGGRRQPPPDPVDNTEDLIAQFERDGILRVPAQDGSGTYTFLPKTNIKHLPVSLYWDGQQYGTCVHHARYAMGLIVGGAPITEVCGGHLDYGGELAYSLGFLGRGNEDPASIVRALLGFIQSGRQIHMNACGAKIGVGLGI